MVTALSALTRLETFDLKFQTHQSLPDQNTRRPPPPMRAVLPALKTFSFRGINEYLEHVLPWIDTPQLDFVNVYLHAQTSNNIIHIPPRPLPIQMSRVAPRLEVGISHGVGGISATGLPALALLSIYT